jgi:hypothetical protein
MKTMIYAAVATVVTSMTCTVVASGPVQDRIPELQRGGSTPAKSVTLTGCVTRGSEAGTYALTNVLKTGDAGAKDAAPSATVVLLGTDIDISKDLDRMVAVTGSHGLEEQAIATTGTEKPAAADAGKEDRPKRTRTFTVTSVKRVADSCTKPAL